MWGQSNTNGMLLNGQRIDKNLWMIEYSLADTTGTNLTSYAEVIYIITGTSMGWQPL